MVVRVSFLTILKATPGHLDWKLSLPTLPRPQEHPFRNIFLAFEPTPNPEIQIPYARESVLSLSSQWKEDTALSRTE